MNKISKVLVAMMSLILVLGLTIVPAFAADPGSGGGTGLKSPSDFLNSASNHTGGSTAINAIQKVGQTARGVVQLIGISAAIIILAVYGVQWFTGGAQQKAQLKDKIWGYVIGAVLCFAGPTIFFALADVVSGLLN